LSQVKDGLNVLQRDAREVIEEDLQSVTCLEVVEQASDRDPRVLKHGLATESLGVYADDIVKG
jgi:hypothetical protein